MKVPFLKTTLGKEEKAAMAKVIDSGWVVMGEKTEEFEQRFADYVGAKHAIFVDSGTAALFLAVQWLEVVPMHYLRVPSLTFTSTAEVVAHSGIRVDFVDVNRKTFCIDGEEESSIGVHLLGNLCKSNSLIFDSAHRIEKNDVKNSTALWCYSFYATKNMTTINGGMIATNNKIAAAWLRKARDHGISQGTIERYKKGKWAYSVDFIGWRLKADDVRAAIGLEQLKKLPEMTKKRNKVVSSYNDLFGLKRTGNHIYPVLVKERPKFIKFMAANGIQTAVHFLPLHKMPAYEEFAEGVELPNTEYLGARLVSLPIFPSMTEKEIEYVATVAKKSGLLINE